MYHEFLFFSRQAWDKESVPLQPREGPAKFADKPCDKWSGTEKDTMFCKLEVWGDPVPSVSFFKGFKDLSSDPRFKIWTDGDSNQMILGIEGLKQEDEGAYRAVLNEGQEGEVEHEFSIYVTGRPKSIVLHNCCVLAQVVFSGKVIKITSSIEIPNF